MSMARSSRLFCQVDVGALEGRGGLLEGLTDQLGDFDELFTHLGELLLKNLTHVCVLSSEILPATKVAGLSRFAVAALQRSTLSVSGELLCPTK
jgi:hypothetical protein